nr:putative cation exchanger c3a12.06c [Quercus suber]
MSSRTACSVTPQRRRRPPYRAARAFYLTLFIATCLGTYALLRHPNVTDNELDNSPIQRRNDYDVIGTFRNEDEECRLVHRHEDQCAFIKKHCPNDEAGFAAYLDLFYCRLSHVKPVAFIILISWLGLLFSTIGIAASDFFCINLSTIASILGMSESMAGVTFLAFGNGSPDVFSTFAAMSTNSGSLAVGELFGAAGFITAVVAGSMALIRPFQVSKRSFIRDVGFFTVAAAFSILFLWDGRLHFWECIVMVAYYIFYVMFVVAWHWWLGRRRKRREREAAVRGHFLAPGDELEVEQEEYHDEPEQHPSRSNTLLSIEDWSALERSGEDVIDEDDEEEARERWMSELSSNMRLTRPPRSRKNTMNPVRPSLVGALEFQAVLKSLQKSRNIQTIPLNARRYSDDPSYTTVQQQDYMSSTSDPATRPPFQITIHQDATPTMERPSLDLAPRSAPPRARAVSVNDATLPRIAQNLPYSNQDVAADNLLDVSHGNEQSLLGIPDFSSNAASPPSPTLEVLPPTPRAPSHLHLDTTQRTLSSNFLAPPGQAVAMTTPSIEELLTPNDAGSDTPQAVPSARSLPRITLPKRTGSRASTPTSSPFPRYRDNGSPISSRPPSLHLPEPIASPESVPAGRAIETNAHQRPTWWWPYSVLPPPGTIISCLFPTIYHWSDKTWWEKCLGLVAAPSVFLLTITLPVGDESDKDKDSSLDAHKGGSLDSARSKTISGASNQSAAGLKGVTPEEQEIDVGAGSHHHSLSSTHGLAGHGNSALIATEIEQQHGHNYGENAHHLTVAAHQHAPFESPLPIDPDDAQPPELWNRWLLIIQLFTAPIFVVFSIYSQSPTELSTTWLIRPILICLVISLVLLIPVLLTSTPTHFPPVYRTIMSLAGFVVSIAWISTIASQVVGALKALAVILNMSHAIMGLTIFAVGNSLGDLVADVTVANLGYPVMALSACIGGPMLNILLGIGLSGSYILLRGAEKRHKHHPDKNLRFKTYEIEVSTTLLVSGATLLVTLVGLLIAVPLNKWVLSKRIGWSLIALWTLSTIGNVLIEVMGWGDTE